MAALYYLSFSVSEITLKNKAYFKNVKKKKLIHLNLCHVQGGKLEGGTGQTRTQRTWMVVVKREPFSEGNGEPLKSLSKGVTWSDLVSLFLCMF